MESKQKNYRFTIFSSCYNKAHCIDRVFRSVESQTYKNFEWILIEDGSTDNSREIIRKYIDKSPVKDKIIYIEQENRGKHRSWNKAVKMATGDLFIPADCDDEFIPETLEFYNLKINELRGGGFCESDLSGISVCCYDPDTHAIVGTPYPEDGMLSDDLELFFRYNVKGEKWGCIRTDLLKKRPFPEVDGKFFTEAWIWHYFSICDGHGYKKANYNKPVRAYFYEPLSLVNDKSRSYRFDRNKIKNQLRFLRFEIFEVGPLIRKYSLRHYMRLYVGMMKSIVAYALSFVR